MQTRFKHYPEKPIEDAAQSAFVILCNAHDAASSFLDIFENTRKARKAKGTPTDEEQDLLRAMLIFASAGLDSMVKQLAADALAMVIGADAGAGEIFKRFIERRLQRGEELDRRLLADVLGDTDPRSRLISELVGELRSESMQAREQLFRAAAFFNIPSERISTDPKDLDAAFRARNEVIHEMDVDFGQPNRNRRPRSRAAMMRLTNTVFQVASTFLAEVDQKLKSAAQLEDVSA